MVCFTPENNAYCSPNVNAFLDTVSSLPGVWCGCKRVFSLSLRVLFMFNFMAALYPLAQGSIKEKDNISH